MSDAMDTAADTTTSFGIEAPPRNTAKVPLPESSVIRKQPNGRASLFINDGEVHQELRCSTAISQHVSSHSLYHSHGLNARTAVDWARPTELFCWHCCHQFEGGAVSTPRTYDSKTQEYVVYGVFCGFPCAKAHVLESDTFNSGLQLSLLEKMARDLYAVEECIVPNPPRLSLSMFGGPFGIEKFRRGGAKCTMHIPPFVCSYMVVEERKLENNRSAYNVNNTGSVRGLRKPNHMTDAQHVVFPEPESTSAYAGFLQDKAADGKHPTQPARSRSQAAGPTTQGPRKAEEGASASTSNGTLAAFMKR